MAGVAAEHMGLEKKTPEPVSALAYAGTSGPLLFVAVAGCLVPKQLRAGSCEKDERGRAWGGRGRRMEGSAGSAVSLMRAWEDVLKRHALGYGEGSARPPPSAWLC